MAEKRFEKTAVYMFAFSILASGINYLFQILAGRLLSTAEYGVMNSAFSIVNIVTVLGVALGLTMAKTIAEDKGETGSKVKSALLFTLFLAIPTVLLVFAIMHFSNYKISYAILCAIAIALINITYVFYGTIQGQKKYLKLSLYNMILPSSKLLFGIALIYIGLSSASAFIAMIIGAALCFIFGYLTLKNDISLSVKAEKKSLIQILRLLVFTLISTACLTFFNNVDILFIRHFFPEEILGLYSAASLFGKIILYVPSVLVVILVPVAAENKTDGRKTMLKSLLYSFCISCI
ncbi:MAG: oligosaccharide flippase family protein, partial [Clostridiales bacterium]|nr:oligosaccharide flippase family protein [Clostridiales bacterium]